MLAEIQEARSEAIVTRDEVRLAQQRVAEQERRLASRLATIEAERAAILGEARAEARRELDEVNQEIEDLRAELGDRQTQSALTKEWLDQARARLEEQEAEVVPLPPPPPPEQRRLPGEITVGDMVWVAGLNTTGQVTGLDGDSAEVQVGSFGVRVKLSNLERRARAQPKEESVPLVSMGSAPAPNLELDLRGQRVEQILPRLDKYLDDAFLAGMPFVRIVHGKGTGALRTAVREQLRNHPLVKSHRSGQEGEGGSGVTVVYLIGD